MIIFYSLWVNHCFFQVIVYLFIAVFTFSYKKRHNQTQRLQNFFACSIALLITAQFSVIFVKAFFPLLERENCVLFRMIQITNMAISRCAAHLFFNDRLRGLSRPQVSQNNRVLKVVSILVIICSVSQLSVQYIYSTIEEQPNVSCNKGLTDGSVGYYFYIGASVLVGALQLLVLWLIVLKLKNHSKLIRENPSIRNGMRSSNLVVKRVLKRIGCSSVVFVTSDLIFIVYVIVKTTISYWHAYFLSVNLTINLIAILCSHNDYRKRFFPFQLRGGRGSLNRGNTVFNIRITRKCT